MALTSFCGLLTLQVGAAILAAVFFTVAGCILAANIFDYHNNILDGWFPFSLVLMLIFVLGLIIAGAFMFASSYAESRALAVAALVTIMILLCYWLILCCFSFISSRDQVDGICIETRCPETFWLGNLRYRRYQFPPGYFNRTYDNGTDPQLYYMKAGLKLDVDQREQVLDETTQRPIVFIVDNNNLTPKPVVEPPSRYVFGAPLLGAILLFIINLLFLLFSALVMYSWASELDWVDYYYEDDPVVLVDDDYY